jgi:hypothetical protein
VLSQFTVNSRSGEKPGAVAGMGAGSAAAAASSAATRQGNATVEGDAARMAREVARQVEKVMLDQKWITAHQESVSN